MGNNNITWLRMRFKLRLLSSTIWCFSAWDTKAILRQTFAFESTRPKVRPPVVERGLILSKGKYGPSLFNGKRRPSESKALSESTSSLVLLLKQNMLFDFLPPSLSLSYSLSFSLIQTHSNLSYIISGAPKRLREVFKIAAMYFQYPVLNISWGHG